MPERRKLKRRHLIYYLRVFDSKTDKLIGYLTDINPEGIMLISEKPIKLKKKFHFKMVLPLGIKERKPLDFDVFSRWSERDINPDFFQTGFQLLNVQQKDIVLIESLIDDIGFRD